MTNLPSGAAPASSPSSFVDHDSGALLPERLQRWRDDATSGALPDAASPSRWQQLRAGVVNMWEFEVAEFWSADGRLQLMGHNETGKSTLMTLTTLIMLSGSTAPHYIDTMGGQNKRFRYYVEPTGLAGDRRDASKHTNRGWVWVEYGRIDVGQPRYFTVLLFADARRADQSKVRYTWAVLNGPARVRGDVTLINGSAVTDPSQLAETPGWHSFGSDGKAYQDYVARNLFTTTADRLDGYVRLLKVMRTPKLGERLNLTFLSEKIREALPPLSTHELTQLAEGWEELERIAADRDSADAARREVDGFRRNIWTPWAAAHVRRAADAYTGATTDFDNVTRTAREAKRTFDEAEGQLQNLDARVAEAKDQQSKAAGELEAHRESDAFTDAQAALQRAQDLDERAALRAKDADRAELDAANVAARADELAATASSADGRVAAKRENEAGVGAVVRGQAADAGLGELALHWVDVGDLDKVEAARDRRADQVTRLISKQSLAKIRADEAASKTDAAKLVADRAEQLDVERTRVRVDLEAEEQRLVDQLGVWVTRLPVAPPASDLVDRWVELVVEASAMPAPKARLAQAISADFIQPVRTHLSGQKATLELQAGQHQAVAEQLSEELERWQQISDPSAPEPFGWHRRTRPAFPSETGGPLWRLVDVADDVADDVRQTLQAALDAAGLLDAWVTPDGAFASNRDGFDTVALIEQTPAPTGQTLASLLTPAPDSAPLASVVTSLLQSIAIITSDAPLPAGLAICPSDGRWTTPVAAGRAQANPTAPALLGAAARARFRAAEIDRLTEEHAQETDRAEAAAASARQLAELLMQMATAEGEAPREDALVQLVLSIHRLDREYDKADEQRGTAEAIADRAQRQADDAAAAASAFAAEHALPLLPSEVIALDERLTQLQLGLVRLRAAAEATGAAVDAADEARRSAATAAEDAAVRAEQAEVLRAEANNLQTQADIARRRLSQEGQQILHEVERLTTLVETLGQQLEGLRIEHDNLIERRAKAAADLDQQTQASEAARLHRDTAEEAWWALVDQGLPAALSVPAPAARNTAAARDHVREARRVVQPRNWPRDDVESQRQRIDQAYTTLTEKLTDLRGTLERGGGRTARIEHDHDNPAVLPRIEVIVDGTGTPYSLGDAVAKLAAQYDELMRAYDSQMQRTLHELLGSAFIEHLRERLESVEALVQHINRILDAHPTGTTGTKLRLVRAPVDGDPAAARVLDALQRELASLNADAQEQVRQFLRARIEEARRTGDAGWRDQLAVELDYRNWFDVRVQKKSAGDQSWKPLDARAHGEMSGGAQVVTLMLPLVAALAAMYEETPTGPRPLWLDEAFDGVDARNRASVLDLLCDFDMDFQLAGPGPLVNTATVPAAAMYEVVRDTRLPGADLTLMLWAAGQLHVIDLADPATIARQSARAAVGDGDDLMSAAGL